MPDGTTFVFDSSYPAIDVAFPIDDRSLQVIVSDRKIEPPPGHASLQLERATGLAPILRNLRTLRVAWKKETGKTCVVIAARGMRQEQLLLNTIYALTLSKNVLFFDGWMCNTVRHSWRKILKASIVGPIRYFFSGLLLRIKEIRVAYETKALRARETDEARYFGLYTRAHSFPIPPDKVTAEEDGSSIYGSLMRGWHMPAFSARRQRHRVQTTRHILQNVSLHVEDTSGSKESSLFKDRRILDYPYFLGRARRHYSYPVSTRSVSRNLDRGINLLAYTSGYYHWLVEGVPRILDVIDDGIDFDQYPLILPPLESYHRQVLALLNIKPESQVVTVDVGEWCHVKECVLPTANFPFADPELEDPSGQPDRALLLRIRDRLLERVDLTSAIDMKGPKRLYISRAKARWRKFSDESEANITALFEAEGFERVFLEEMPFTRQVQLLAGAEFIAGLHGAGLTNILFSDAKALLELHNPMEVRPYFAWIARELHMDYAYVIGSLRCGLLSFDQITIHIPSVEKALKRTLGNQAHLL
jgi:hypothetical protein